MTEAWISTAEVAERFGIPVETVRYWRHIGYGPLGVKLGRHVRYRPSDWDAFEKELQQEEKRKREAV